MNGDYITLKEFTGETKEGFELSHPSLLPKSAKLDRYTYDEQYNSYAIYVSFGKKGTKYFIIKSRV